MRVLLLFPKWTGDYGLFGPLAKKASTFPPLNLAYLASIAETMGHEVKIIDGEAENVQIEAMAEQAIMFKPDFIGITATTPFFHIAVNLAQELKRNCPKIPIAIGGPHITILKEEAFHSAFDYAFIGEAEESWPLFLKQFERKADYSFVKGILYRENGKIVFTGEARFISNIDAIPFPARHLLKTDKYEIGTLHGRKRFTTVMSARGCPFQCIFCSRKVFGTNIRKRSPFLVVNEIESITTSSGVRHIIFLDDTLTIDRKHTLDLCHEILNRKLSITFEGSTRANLIDEELIETMVSAGLRRISFGLESVDAEIRKTMKKEVPLESYQIANRLTNKYDIETLNSCMIGLPGETVASIRKTLFFLRQSREIKQANLSIATPYPGTELYEMAKRGQNGLKLLTNDFSKFRRYNSAVMSVGNLSPQDLIRLQNDAFVSIYLAPWRFIPMLKKSGVVGVLLTMVRLVKSLKRIVLNQDGLFRFEKNGEV